jgi:hypothetical protein
LLGPKTSGVGQAMVIGGLVRHRQHGNHSTMLRFNLTPAVE